MRMTRMNQQDRPEVLIVEDEPKLRELLVRMCHELGFTAEAAASGEQGLRLLDENRHGVLIADLNLPGISGLDMIDQIRQREHSKRTPGVTMSVIVLTGFGDLQSAQQAIRLDAADFLTKPCHLGELEKALDRAWRNWRNASSARGPQPQSSSAESGPQRSSQDEAQAEGTLTMEEMERRAIETALARHDGNRRAAADDRGSGGP